MGLYNSLYFGKLIFSPSISFFKQTSGTSAIHLTINHKRKIAFYSSYHISIPISTPVFFFRQRKSGAFFRTHKNRNAGKRLPEQFPGVQKGGAGKRKTKTVCPWKLLERHEAIHLILVTAYHGSRRAASLRGGCFQHLFLQLKYNGFRGRKRGEHPYPPGFRFTGRSTAARFCSRSLRRSSAGRFRRRGIPRSRPMSRAARRGCGGNTHAAHSSESCANR